MMRYNKRSTIYSSFGLIVMGMVLVVLNSVAGLVPESSRVYPSWLPKGLVRSILGLSIGLDIFGIMLVGFYTLLQALARMETENLDLKLKLATIERDVQRLGVVVGNILGRESERHGPPDSP